MELKEIEKKEKKIYSVILNYIFIIIIFILSFIIIDIKTKEKSTKNVNTTEILGNKEYMLNHSITEE